MLLASCAGALGSIPSLAKECYRKKKVFNSKAFKCQVKIIYFPCHVYIVIDGAVLIHVQQQICNKKAKQVQKPTSIVGMKNKEQKKN